MSNCRGTYAFLTYLIAFSKLAAPRRKKRQVVSLLLRRESLSLYHEQEYMCSCVPNGAADAECCHLPGVRRAAPISLCAPLFHSGLQPTVPGGRGGRASRIRNWYLSEFMGAQVSLLFLLYSPLLLMYRHAPLRAYVCVSLPSHATYSTVTHPLGIGYASVSEEWRRPA